MFVHSTLCLGVWDIPNCQARAWSTAVNWVTSGGSK